MGAHARLVALGIVSLLTVCVTSQRDEPSTAENEAHSDTSCDCMEYWNCVMSGGSPYSYCGISENSVCCFVPKNARPVGLLPSPSRPTCGKKGQNSGRDGFADLGEWPWHAAILEKPEELYVCGASLLDQSWVLTAAHCVDDYLELGPRVSDVLKVRLGEYDVTTTSEPLRHEEFDVAAVLLYPQFNNRSLAHDIALLRLAKPARRRDNIDVVCTPRLNAIPETPQLRCVVTGWGRRTEGTDHSVVLKEVPVPLWNNAACEGALRSQFGPSYKLPDTSICAGTEGRDACDGDGGGPLVCEKDGLWYQIGVVSFGIGCGRKNTPGVYTKVAMYERWIKDTVLSSRISK